MEIAGLERDTPLNGVRQVWSGRRETNAGRVTVVPREGRRVNVRTGNLKVCDQIGVKQLVPESNRSAVALRDSEGAPTKAMVESQFLTHTPHAPVVRCMLCVQARGTGPFPTRRSFQMRKCVCSYLWHGHVLRRTNDPGDSHDHGGHGEGLHRCLSGARQELRHAHDSLRSCFL